MKLSGIPLKGFHLDKKTGKPKKTQKLSAVMKQVQRKSKRVSVKRKGTP